MKHRSKEVLHTPVSRTGEPRQFWAASKGLKLGAARSQDPAAGTHESPLEQLAAWTKKANAAAMTPATVDEFERRPSGGKLEGRLLSTTWPMAH